MTVPPSPTWPERLGNAFGQVIKYGTFALLGIGGASVWQWSQVESRQPPPEVATAPLLTQADTSFETASIERLRIAIRTRTVSYQAPTPEQAAETRQAFDTLHAHFKKSYPTVYRELQPERRGNSLLLRWPGENPQAPALLMAAHLDVVPAVASEWSQAPFSGALHEGFVWGRGTLDDKATATALLEALERQLQAGTVPAQDIYLAFGEDEEIGGSQGAQQLASHLKAQGVKLAAVIDEGLVIVPGSMIGLPPPVALIGVAEKGYITLELSVEQAGGHTSMPGNETAVDILARGLVRLRENPLPARLEGPARQLFDWLGPEMSGFRGWALANLWLTEPLLLQQLQQKPATAALVRTTVAPTVLKGSAKENVLASRASALLNLRVLPGDTLEGIQAHFQTALQDERIQIVPRSADFSGQASTVSATDSQIFGRLSQSIRQVFPEALVAPSLVLAATDSRHYEEISENIYRFQPVYFSEADLDRLHGHDERISVESYIKSIGFFEQFFLNVGHSKT